MAAGCDPGREEYGKVTAGCDPGHANYGNVTAGRDGSEGTARARELWTSGSWMSWKLGGSDSWGRPRAWKYPVHGNYGKATEIKKVSKQE